MLKFTYKTQAEIPAAHAGFYIEKDGVWQLNVDGAVSKESLDQFRQQGIDALKAKDAEIKALEGFKGMDLTKVQEALTIVSGLDAGTLKKAADVDAAVNQRTAALKKELEDKVKAAEDRATALTGQLEVLSIDEAVKAAGMELGVLPEAAGDLTTRARSVFKLKDGKPVATGPDGQPMYGTDAQPLSVKDYVAGLATKDAKHLFKPNTGAGGAGGGSKGAAHTGPNPFAKETRNLTQQMVLQRTDPGKAAQLAAAAGVTIPTAAAV